MIKRWVQSRNLLQLHLLVPKDGQWAPVEKWAFTVQNPPSCCLEKMNGDRSDAGCRCILILHLNIPCRQQPISHRANKGRNGLSPEPLGALGLPPFASQCDCLVAGKRRRSLGMATTFIILSPCTAILTANTAASSSSVQSNWLQEITSGLAFKIQKIHNNIFE